MSESLYLYITGSEVYLRRRAGYLGRGTIEQIGTWRWNASDPASLSFAELENINWNKRRELHVYVGSALCKFLVTDLPESAKEQEYKTLVAAQMVHKLGLNTAEWDLTCEADRRNKKLFACAVRKALVERIKALARERRLKLFSVKPFAAAIWNTFAKTVDASHNNNSLIALESDALTTFTAQAGVLQTMHSFYHRQEPDLISREVRRLQLSTAEEHDVVIALPATLHHLASDHSERILRKLKSGPACCAGDFSDMMLLNETEDVLDDAA